MTREFELWWLDDEDFFKPLEIDKSTQDDEQETELELRNVR